MRAVLILGLFLGMFLPGSVVALDSKVIAYYFYGNARCSNCYKLEKYTRAAVERNFKKELEAGILEFQAINVEEPENEHFVKYYQLYTKSVVLSLRKGDKEVKAENLQQVWEYLGNESKFIEFVTGRVRQYLGEL